MLTITIASLSGGQGKTTVALILGRLLADRGYSTLLIDADPQHNLTDWAGLEVGETDPTLLEVIKKTISIDDGIYQIEGQKNLFLIPADNQLDTAHDYLAGSGVGATLLKKRLESAKKNFRFCVIDSPPQRSQMALSAIGASDFIVIPAQTHIKGYGSLTRTLDLIKICQESGATEGEILGVLPFADRWFGGRRHPDSQKVIDAMEEEVGELILPSIKDSERYKQAINRLTTPGALGYPDLEYPFNILIEKLIAKVGD